MCVGFAKKNRFIWQIIPRQLLTFNLGYDSFIAMKFETLLVFNSLLTLKSVFCELLKYNFLSNVKKIKQKQVVNKKVFSF